MTGTINAIARAPAPATAADLRLHYDAIRARLHPARSSLVPFERIQPPRKRTNDAHLYPYPIGPVRIVAKPVIVYGPPSQPEIKLPRRVRIGTIVEVVSAVYGIYAGHIRSTWRKQPYAEARQVAYYVARELTTRSLPEIGMAFKGRDHTTVLHGIRVIEAKCAANPDFKARVDLIIATVEARS